MEIYFCIIWRQILTCKSIAVDITLQNLDPYLVHFSRSVVSNSLWPHELPHARPLSITNSRSSLKLMSIESIQPLHSLSSPSPPPSIFPQIGVFSNESILCIRGPKYWSFSFSISPSNEYLGLISFRMDWLDLLAVQGTLKSLLQHHSSKHQVFSAQLSS